MIELALWVGTVLLLLVGLLIGLSVLKAIFIEGVQRQRSGGNSDSGDRTGEPRETSGEPRDRADTLGESTGPATDAGSAATAGRSGSNETATVVCNACETRNDAAYTFCQECTQRL